ncbi:MAG TPA: NAD(P)H-binding protein [Thermoanaerobaculia bacterium]|nr:NAD(P)H-binding protein [Thermoanaerobaculia bacterium]
MQIQRITVIGATGNLGRPVTRELIDAGYEVTVAARDPRKAADLGAAAVVEADLFDIPSLRNALRGADAVYLNLSTKPGERPSGPHSETHGLRRVIEVSREMKVRQIAMLSSLVLDYQGHEGFDWWAFDVKRQAIRLLQESGICSTIFRASSFFENFNQRSKGKIALPGKSKHPMWFIAGQDYGKQVARAFAMHSDQHREYAVQGPEPFTYDEAARVFAANYPKEQLKITHPPMFVLKTLGLVSRQMDYFANIVEALNEYAEEFSAQKTWEELGKPTTTLAEWAKTAP